MRRDDDQAHARIRRFWEARAREDALRYSVPGAAPTDPERFAAAAEPLLRTVADLVGWDPAGATTILDLGCGAGRLTGALAARAETVVACDIAPTMLRRARERHAALDGVRWHAAAADRLECVDAASIDAAIALGVVAHLPTVTMIGAVLQALGGALRPDATVVFDVRAAPAPLRLPGEDVVPAHVARHPLWSGVAVDLETLDVLVLDAGLVIERIAGSGGERCLVLARRG